VNDENNQNVLRVKTEGFEASIPSEALNTLGVFFNDVVGIPLKHLGGMAADRIVYWRWTQGVKLAGKINEKLAELPDGVGRRSPPPKFSIPLIETAVLEDDDALIGVWAQLLVSSIHEDFSGKVRVAFIDILKQLEPLDIKILDYCFQVYIKNISARKPFFEKNVDDYPEVNDVCFDKVFIERKMRIKPVSCVESLDNLFRCNLIKSLTKTEQTLTAAYGSGSHQVIEVERSLGYESFSFTQLGFEFMRSCTGTYDIFKAAGVDRVR
jgi:Abortive infection alpha